MNTVSPIELPSLELPLDAGPATASAAPAGSGLLDAVVSVRDSTEAAFLATGKQLIHVAGLLEAARHAALSVDTDGQIALLNRLRAEADCQAATFAALTSEFAETRSGIRTLTSELAGLGHDLEAVRRSVVTMRSVVLNARVTLASLLRQDMNLLNFAESGQAVVSEISDLLMRFEQTMEVILRAVDLTERMVGQIDATMHTEVLSAFDALMNDLAEFESRVRSVSGRGTDLSRRLQAMIDATGRAVAGLQVGDSTRQQLDHVAFILALPQAADPDLRALVAALLHDAARAHSAMLDQLRASVAEMTEGLADLVEAHLSSLFGTPGQAIASSVLIDGSARLSRAIAALHPMQEQTRALGRTLADEFEAFRSLISKGEGVQDSTHLIGINAVLSCMRLGQDGAALKVVAEQLQVVSREVGDRFATIRIALSKVSTLGDRITTGTSHLVQKSIRVPEQLIGTIGPMVQSVIDHLEPVQKAVGGLQDSLSDLAFDFRPAMTHLRQLEGLAKNSSTIRSFVQAGGMSTTGLTEIYAVFTMERERETFRALFPDHAIFLEQAQPMQPVGTEDDMFFL